MVCSLAGQLRAPVSEFVADVSGVFCAASCRLRLEIRATVSVITLRCWQRFGGSAPSCLLTAGAAQLAALIEASGVTETLQHELLFHSSARRIRYLFFKWNMFFIWHYFFCKKYLKKNAGIKESHIQSLIYTHFGNKKNQIFKHVLQSVRRPEQ